MTDTTPTTIAEFIAQHPDLRMEVGPGEAGVSTDTADRPWQFTAYPVTLREYGLPMTLTYRMGLAHTTEPELDMVLDAIRADDPTGLEDFEDWCLNYGENPDSRTAHAMWESCREQTAAARRLLGERALDDLLGCEGL